jgi:hypothetical protein
MWSCWTSGFGPAVCGGFYRVKPARKAGLLFAVPTGQVTSSVSARMA